MPVSVQTPLNEFTGNASTTVFPYTFLIILETDLAVYLDGVKQTTGFTITGAGVDAGGDVTFTTAPGSGVVVRLERLTTIQRTTDYLNGGSLNADTLDADFDRSVMIVQELDRRSLQQTSDDKFDAETKVIKNVVDPVSAQDAATKHYVDTAGTSQVVLATTQANNAAASASAASTSATNAATSAINAGNSESNAATSELVASTSASSATSSASAASTSAGNAATSATNAAASATTASTSAGNAATSATNAATSATAAAASYVNFDDRYLGQKASDPTLDNYGNALLTGALYFNTVSNEMRVWSGSAWVATFLPAGAYVAKAGDTMTGPLILNADPSNALGAATKQTVDTKVAKAGDTMSGTLNMGTHSITNVVDPFSAQDAATKNYVDTGTTTLTNALAGKAPLASPALTGTPTINGSPAHSDANTGVCRAWVNFNGTGTVAIRASYNVSSISDNGVGAYGINFTSPMADANYSVAGTAKGAGGEVHGSVSPSMTVGPTASSVAIVVYGNSTTITDSDTVSVVINR